MDILIIAVLIIAAVILFLVELFVIPGISLAGISALACILYANYYAFANMGMAGGFVTLGISALACIGSLIWFMRSKMLDKLALKKDIDSKVDRSAAYAARYVAKNVVAAGLADKCEIQLAYAIGVAQPVSVLVDTFGTGKIDDDKIAELIKKNFSLSPSGIIKTLDLLRPIYKQTAAYGHFGRTDVDLPWEHTDKAETLRKQAGL